MVKLNTNTLFKILKFSFLLFLIYTIFYFSSFFPSTGITSSITTLEHITFSLFMFLLFPLIFFIGGLLLELPYYYIYENKVYNYDSKIIMSGYSKTNDYQITKSTLLLKTYQKEFNNIIILITAEYTLTLKTMTLLEFKSEIDSISEKLFYFFRYKSRVDKRYEYSLNNITYVINLKNESLNIENILEGFDEFDIEKEKLFDPYETYSDWA